VVVEGISLVKRHTRPNPSKNLKGGIVEREAPIHISNVVIVCGACGQPTRIGHQTLSDGKKIRICRKCEESLDR
jgi:large subunit ribosomal protein L24